MATGPLCRAGHAQRLPSIQAWKRHLQDAGPVRTLESLSAGSSYITSNMVPGGNRHHHVRANSSHACELQIYTVRGQHVIVQGHIPARPN